MTPPLNDEYSRLMQRYRGTVFGTIQMRTEAFNGRMPEDPSITILSIRCAQRERGECISSIMKAAVPHYLSGYAADEQDLELHELPYLIAKKPGSSDILMLFDTRESTYGCMICLQATYSLDDLGLTRDALVEYKDELQLQSQIAGRREQNTFPVWDGKAFAIHLTDVLKFRLSFLQFGFACDTHTQTLVHDEWMLPTIVKFVTNSSEQDVEFQEMVQTHFRVFKVKNNGIIHFMAIHIKGVDNAIITFPIALQNGSCVTDPWNVVIRPNVVPDMALTARIRTVVAELCDLHEIPDTPLRGDVINNLMLDVGAVLLAVARNGAASDFFVRSIGGASPALFVSHVLKCVLGCDHQDIVLAAHTIGDCPRMALIDLADEMTITPEANGYRFTLSEHGLSRRSAPAVGFERGADRAHEFRKFASEARHVVRVEPPKAFIDSLADAKQSYIGGQTSFYVHSLEKTDFEPEGYVASSIAIPSPVSLEFITPVLKYVFSCEDEDLLCSVCEKDRAGELFTIHNVGDVIVTPEGEGYRIDVFSAVV